MRNFLLINKCGESTRRLIAVLEGDEWKEDKFDYRSVSMSAVYALTDLLHEHLLRSSDYASEFFGIVDAFKPTTETSKAWKRECIDSLVRGYVDNDPVFVSAFEPREFSKEWNAFYQVRSAYYEGIFHAVRHGLWSKEAAAWLDEYEKGRKRSNNDSEADGS